MVCFFGPGARLAVARSTTSRSSTAMTARMVMAANIVSVCMRAFDWIMTKPSPAEAPTHSPMTAPSGASGAATLSPEMSEGSASGTRSRVRICQWLASVSEAASRIVRSVRLRPSVKAEATGKKMMIAVMTTFEAMPKPNQSTRMGASTKTGNACNTRTMGQTRRPKRGTAAIVKATRMPAAMPAASPTAISPDVTMACPNRKAGWRRSAAATSAGEGRM